MVKKKMASASMQALDAKIQSYKDILGIKKKAEAEVPAAAPAINPSQDVGNNVASTVDKLVDRIEAAINEVKELGDSPDTTEKAKEQMVASTGSSEQEVKKESSETGETTVKDTSKEDTSEEEDKESKEAVLKIRRIVAHSTKLAKLQIAQKLADARNFEKTAGVNPAALATLAAILGVGGGVYAGTRNPNMISDIKNRFGGGAAPAAPAPAAPAPERTVVLPTPKKDPVRIPASTETPDKFSQDAIKAYNEAYDPQSQDRLFDFETDPREFKGSDVYGGIPTSEIKDLEAVDKANRDMRESGIIGGITEQEINEYLKEHEEDMARQNTISAQRDFLNAEKEDFYGNQPAEVPQDTEEGSLFDAAADPAMAEKGKEYLKEIDPEQETMYKKLEKLSAINPKLLSLLSLLAGAGAVTAGPEAYKALKDSPEEASSLEKLEALDDEALGKLARTNPKMLAALLGALGITGAGAGAYAMSRGGAEPAPSADPVTEEASSLLGAAMAAKAGAPQDPSYPEVPTDMLRESGVEIGANGEQRPIDNFQDPNSGETLDYDAVSKELEDYIKGQQEGDTGVMPWEK